MKSQTRNAPARLSKLKAPEPKCRQIGSPSLLAMSLSQRLRNLQIPAAARATESLDHLTLEDLSSEVVSFGQKHSGSTYADTWQDQEWVHFMINRYQNSQKEAHRRYLKFVELKIESLEQTQMIIPREPSAKSRPVSKAKAMAKNIATPSVISSLDGETDWDIDPETYGPVITASHVTPLAEDVQAMQQRMLNLENALTKVIHHLENQNFPENNFHQEGNP